MIAYPPAPQPSTPPYAFVVLAPTGDTIAVERVTPTAGESTADLRLVAAGGSRVRHTLTLGADGTVTRFRLEAFLPGSPPDAAPAQQLTFAWGRDSVHVSGGGANPSARAVAPGTFPWLNPSFALVEQLVRRARALGGASASLPMLSMAGGSQFTAAVTRGSADTMVVAFPDVEMHVAVDGEGRVTGGWVPAQRVRVLRVAADAPGAESARPARPTRPADYSPPPGAPYAAEEVRVPTEGGFTLGGTLTRPAGVQGRVPVVLLLTGSGAQDRDEGIPAFGDYRPFRDVADTLGRRGIAVLRLDDRGVGASGGSLATATIADIAGDARAAVRWLRTRPDVDPRRIALLGHSEGGIVAPMVAADDPAIAAVVLMAGSAQRGRDIIHYQFGAPLRRPGAPTGAARDSLERRLGVMADSMLASSPWMRFFADYDPLTAARRVRAPVLVLQGATDRQVTPEQATELATAMRGAGNGAVTVRVFPETNHLFLADPSGDPTGYAALPSKRVRPEVLGALADWLAARLGAAREPTRVHKGV